jgi:hypothetical protein
MTAYGNQDKGFAGLKDSLGGFVESWKASSNIDFGAPVFAYEGDAVSAYPYINDTIELTNATPFITGNVIAGDVDGEAFSVPFDTDHETTQANLVAALEALPTVDDAVVILIQDPGDGHGEIALRKKGSVPVLTINVTGGASQPALTQVAASSQVFIGISMFTQKEAAGDAGYKTNDAMNVLSREGRIFALISTDTVANKEALLDLTTGKFANTGDSVNCIFRENATQVEGIALVEVRGQVPLSFADKF